MKVEHHADDKPKTRRVDVLMNRTFLGRWYSFVMDTYHKVDGNLAVKSTWTSYTFIYNPFIFTRLRSRSKRNACHNCEHRGKGELRKRQTKTMKWICGALRQLPQDAYLRLRYRGPWTGSHPVWSWSRCEVAALSSALGLDLLYNVYCHGISLHARFRVAVERTP